jgi:hypothetical protein
MLKIHRYAQLLRKEKSFVLASTFFYSFLLMHVTVESWICHDWFHRGYNLTLPSSVSPIHFARTHTHIHTMTLDYVSHASINRSTALSNGWLTWLKSSVLQERDRPITPPLSVSPSLSLPPPPFPAATEVECERWYATNSARQFWGETQVSCFTALLMLY